MHFTFDVRNAHEVKFFHTDGHWLVFYPMEQVGS
jgi:hypothetical protein